RKYTCRRSYLSQQPLYPIGRIKPYVLPVGTFLIFTTNRKWSFTRYCGQKPEDRCTVSSLEVPASWFVLIGTLAPILSGRGHFSSALRPLPNPSNVPGRSYLSQR